MAILPYNTFSLNPQMSKVHIQTVSVLKVSAIYLSILRFCDTDYLHMLCLDKTPLTKKDDIQLK